MKLTIPCNPQRPALYLPPDIRGFGSGFSEQGLRGNDAIVESMEKSYDFPTLPTMAWIPLRGIHIPTKPTAILFDREKRKPQKQNQPKD
jgi:hypothetical protein